MPQTVAEVRYELRDSIHQIIGYSELLQEQLATVEGPQPLGDLQRITQAARRLELLVRTGPLAESFTAGQVGLPARLAANGLATNGLAANGLAETGEATFDPTAELSSTQTATQMAAALDSLESAAHQGPPLRGVVLVVDDNAINRDLLSRRLARQGLSVYTAAGGEAAFELLHSHRIDVVLLDAVMPQPDGLAVLTQLKSDPKLRHIPVIMLSGVDEFERVIRCIQAGAEDYLPKPLNGTLLRARLSASLDRKLRRDVERDHLRAIETAQRRLTKELNQAADYVCSIFPARTSEPFAIDWKYQPSGEVGGDSFGYHWIDDEHFAVYLLDVCGHGFGAALLSVAAINSLRTPSLPNTNYRDPSSVMARLNELFQMTQHNDMYFTLWYGVYHRPTRQLTYATAGHPPALLIDRETDQTQRLNIPGLMIGAIPENDYATKTVIVPPQARLFVLSDGCYEIYRPDRSMLSYDEFADFMARESHQDDCLDRLLNWVLDMHGPGSLEDDFSIVGIRFD
ncbi:MAG: PP2C family protein-serine/threonine phosphatase [Planctomycetota bacterium]